MSKEDFISVIESGLIPDEEVLADCIDTMYLDAEEACELVSFINRLYFIAVESTGLFVQHDIHNCARRYEKTLSQKGDESNDDLFPLYQVELTYYYFSNSLADCLHYVNLVLESGKSNPEEKATALSYATTIFSRKKMYRELRTYISKSAQLLKGRRLETKTRCFLYMDILEAYALQGKTQDFYRSYADALTLFESMIDNDYEDSFISSYSQALEIRRLLNDITSGESSDLNEAKNRFTAIMNTFNPHSRDWLEDYPTLLLPIIQYLADVIPVETIISYSYTIMETSAAPIDKIKFLSFLIDGLKISSTEYQNIYDDYFNVLRLYYEDSLETTGLAVQNEYKSHLAELEIRKLSVTDDLTRLGNRRAFRNSLEEFRLSESPVNLIILAIDVNGLKSTNDTYGHSAGDELLGATAEILRVIFSGTGSCYRLGGDEFAVLVNSDFESFKNTLSKLDDAIFEYRCSFGSGISISYGYSVSSEHPELNYEELYRIADSNMYIAKKQYYNNPENDRRTSRKNDLPE